MQWIFIKFLGKVGYDTRKKYKFLQNIHTSLGIAKVNTSHYNIIIVHIL